ncbi:DinB family protein [Flammeovirgaceae bacterium SG7u.111]|nr:DinB family protein [Flammeovirgaceae bacterium SG7u.132]WPO33506.1 DinB family protein [Flammeovirgaceae bacterium SG7u.111]
MQLTDITKSIFGQLSLVISQLTDESYSRKLDVLGGKNTIGQHYRHILEFYDCLLIAAKSGRLSYDERKRELSLETNVKVASAKINELEKALIEIEPGKQLQMSAVYGDDNDPFMMITSTERELAFNLEHAIHHIAIIKIALLTDFPTVELPTDFGVAFSTLRYQKQAKSTS